MRKIMTRTSTIAVAAVAVTGVGVAFAAWTATGTGTGSATAKSAAALTSTVGTATAQLYPGGTSGLLLKVNNSNDYDVTLASVSQTPGQSITVDAAHPNCNVSSVTFSDVSGLNQVLTAKSTDVVVTGLGGKVAMSKAANDDCQGATFTVPVTLAGASS